MIQERDEQKAMPTYNYKFVVLPTLTPGEQAFSAISKDEMKGGIRIHARLCANESHTKSRICKESPEKRITCW